MNEASFCALLKYIYFLHFFFFFTSTWIFLSRNCVSHSEVFCLFFYHWLSMTRSDVRQSIVHHSFLPIKHKITEEMKRNASYRCCKRPRHCRHCHHLSLPCCVHSRCFDCLNLHLPPIAIVRFRIEKARHSMPWYSNEHR